MPKGSPCLRSQVTYVRDDRKLGCHSEEVLRLRNSFVRNVLHNTEGFLLLSVVEMTEHRHPGLTCTSKL